MCDLSEIDYLNDRQVLKENANDASVIGLYRNHHKKARNTEYFTDICASSLPALNKTLNIIQRSDATNLLNFGKSSDYSSRKHPLNQSSTLWTQFRFQMDWLKPLIYKNNNQIAKVSVSPF